MQFKSTYLALALLAGFGLALGACSSSSDDGPPDPDITLDQATMGHTVEEGTHVISEGLAAAFDDVSEEAAAKYLGTDHDEGTIITIAGLDIACTAGPCSVVLNDNGTITTTGTIEVVMAGGEFPTAMRPAEPTDPEPTEEEKARAQIAELQKQINALRVMLGMPEIDIDELTGSVSELEGQVADLNQQIADAAEEEKRLAEEAKKAEEEKAAKDNAKLGKAMYAALGPNQGGTTALTNIGVTTLGSAGLKIDAAAGAGALDDGTDPGEVTLKVGDSVDSLGSWSGTSYAHSAGTGAAKVSNDAVVYTNKGPATGEPFGEAYTLITTEGKTKGMVEVVATNLGLVMGAAFEHSGTQTHVVPDQSDGFYTRGTYAGAPGEYRCTGTVACTSTNDGKGAPEGLAGTWHFKPDAGAMTSVADAEYLYFGWWVSKDKDGMPTAASAFAGVVEPNAGDLDTGGDLTAITGSATYEGHAAGKFALNDPVAGTGNAGHFTADAELEATFTGTKPGVTGTIDNFRLNDGSDDPGWSVSLALGALGSSGGTITAPAADATVWSINGNEAKAGGTWSGTMYDEAKDGDADDGSNLPTTVTGTFYSEFNDQGRMAGAFGAEKTE